jgi:Flp pilus assembly protein TadG
MTVKSNETGSAKTAPPTPRGPGTGGAPSRRALRRSGTVLDEDRGSSAIELVLITPVLIALVFGLIQTALVWNARHTVSSAAQHGARLARTATALNPTVIEAAGDAGATDTSTASDELVKASTLQYLRQTGGAGLADPTVTIRHDGSYVSVTVTGTTLGVLPGTHVQVTGSSRTPVEGYRP